MKNKLKAIWNILMCNKFYLITANKYLVCTKDKSKNIDYKTIIKMIDLNYSFYKKQINNEKYRFQL